MTKTIISIITISFLLSSCKIRDLTPSKIPDLTSTPTSFISPSPLLSPTPQPITLDAINSLSHGLDPYNLQQSPGQLLLVTGDYNPGRSVNTKILKQDNPSFMLTHTANILNQGHITLTNLEGTLMQTCAPTNSGMRFCGHPGQAQALSQTGITLASLANNHATDFGTQGHQETIDHLSEAGIKPITQYGYTLFNLGTTTAAIIGIDTVIHPFNEPRLIQTITEAKSQAQLIIPFFHWGNEYTTKPTQQQRQIAHLSIDSGASLVLGNHSHWVGAAEIYQDKLIVYSHGNFVFDQMWSQETRQGIIGAYWFHDANLSQAAFIPIYINSNYQPQLAQPELKSLILQTIFSASNLNLE